MLMSHCTTDFYLAFSGPRTSCSPCGFQHLLSAILLVNCLLENEPGLYRTGQHVLGVSGFWWQDFIGEEWVMVNAVYSATSGATHVPELGVVALQSGHLSVNQLQAHFSQSSTGDWAGFINW